MDRLATLELFVRVMERRSFSAAAADLGMSRPGATAGVQALEARLGVRLLQRSSRHVAPTAEGEAYYARCVAILRELEDADRGAGGAVRGVVRADVPGMVARAVILPALPGLLARYPELVLQLGEGERFVDLLREGVDLVLRGGEPADSEMMVRRLGALEEMTCASPAYLAAHGVPASPDALDGHWMVGFVSSRTGQALPLEFTRDGAVVERVLPSRVLVHGADTAAQAARLGLGLVQAPRFRFAEDLAAGRLVEVLAAFPPAPMPISVMVPSRRQVPARVRVVMDWLVEVVGERLGRSREADAAAGGLTVAARFQDLPMGTAES